LLSDALYYSGDDLTLLTAIAALFKNQFGRFTGGEVSRKIFGNKKGKKDI